MLGRDSGSLGQLWVGSKVGLRARMQVERAKIFVANFSYFLGIVGRFMPAALDGAGGKLQGTGCGVWAANLYLHEPTALGLSPMA